MVVKPAQASSQDDAEPPEQLEGEDAEDAPAPAESKRRRRKNETFELVEYSSDELAGVDKEMLNAEITQLEGKLRDPRCLPNIGI